MIFTTQNIKKREVYRYMFQGQEADHEIKGEGNSINYKYRMHDPRIGRFFAVDPLAPKYPYYTPYAFSGNQVIHMVELEGLEPAIKKVGTETRSIEGVKDFSYQVDVFKPNPSLRVDLNQSGFSDLAEGDPIYVNDELLVNHCGIVNFKGEIYGDGLYPVDEYVKFAISPEPGPYFNPSELEGKRWGYNINFQPEFYPYSVINSGVYTGIDKNSGEGEVLTYFKKEDYFYLGPSSPALQHSNPFLEEKSSEAFLEIREKIVNSIKEEKLIISLQKKTIDEICIDVYTQNKEQNHKIACNVMNSKFSKNVPKQIKIRFFAKIMDGDIERIKIFNGVKKSNK